MINSIRDADSQAPHRSLFIVLELKGVCSKRFETLSGHKKTVEFLEPEDPQSVPRNYRGFEMLGAFGRS